jgi:hypothetical protein
MAMGFDTTAHALGVPDPGMEPVGKSERGERGNAYCSSPSAAFLD